MLIRNQDFAPDLLELIGAAEQLSVDRSALSAFSHVATADPFDGLSEPSCAVAARRAWCGGGSHFPNRSVQLGRIAKGDYS
jgi:hypothetical protein